MKTVKSIAILLLLVLVACYNGKISFSTDDLDMAFDSKGNNIILKDKSLRNDYSYKVEGSSLLTIRVKNEYEQPSALKFDRSDSTISLTYPAHNITAQIKVRNRGMYLTFELVSITKSEEVEIVWWGPFRTTIDETIGETIGVVRNKDFAIGIQALNPRTLGGYPTNEDDSFRGYDIFSTTSLVDVADSVHILYRGDAARPEKYGSSLSAYTRSRDKDRVVACMDHDRYLSRAYVDEGITGSKIALFGCTPERVLDVIENIELNEGLPHPLLNGEWAKRSRQSTAAYLIQYFDTKNYDKAIDLTIKAGLKYLYHGHPFRTWGHFELINNMTWDDLGRIVDDAEKKGIKVGAHTLSNFITTNDTYVTPVPDSRLAKVGSSVLKEDITGQDKTIVIEDPSFFNQMKNNSLHAVVIGDELIRYENVSETEPWSLINCERGAFGTSAAIHIRGSVISKLADHPYNVFLTDNALSAEVSGRIADLYNQTGLKQISFDGLEGNYSTGMGSYGELLFVKNWFDRLAPEIKNDYIMDASRPGHYFWHMFTRMNWGEPWYAGFRESQTTLRLLNQDYFRRNYIPCMLGWFNMGPSTSIEDIEWMLARSAAFDAGYALVTDASIVEKNGYGEQILEKIKQWEIARMSGAFSNDQKKRMENIRAEFTLNTIGENHWQLVPFDVQRFEHEKKALQPGQPAFTQFEFNNPWNEQPLQFIISVTSGSASGITIEFDEYRKTELNAEIKTGQKLKYDGGNSITLYSDTWQKIREIPVKKESFFVAGGKHTIKVDCSFNGQDDQVLKIEMKVAGQPEDVGDTHNEL